MATKVRRALIQERELSLYLPHSVQLAFHNSKARYRVAALGRQAGKSTMCLNDLAMRAWCNPGTTYWFVSPTYDQAKIQYRRMVGMLSTCWETLLKKNQTELRVKFINQSQVRFVSGEVLENLRGETLHGAVIDEVRDQPAMLWPMIIRPMLSTTKGWCAFVGTPNGFDEFYELHQRGLNGDAGWESFHAPSTCNPLFSKEEYDEAKADMTEDVFAQEILAEFREIGKGKAYMNHGPHNQVLENPFAVTGREWSQYLPITVGPDFNVGLMCWALGQYRAGDEWYFGDEIVVPNTNTQECAKLLVEKVKDHKPGVEIIGDASGKARRSSASGETDYTIMVAALKEAGIPVRNLTPESNPAVKDRMNIMNGRLRSADGKTHLWYRWQKMPTLKRDFERVITKNGTQGFIIDKSNPLLTHISDGAGYPVCFHSTLTKKAPGTMRVIIR